MIRGRRASIYPSSAMNIDTSPCLRPLGSGSYLHTWPNDKVWRGQVTCSKPHNQWMGEIERDRERGKWEFCLLWKQTSIYWMTKRWKTIRIKMVMVVLWQFQVHRQPPGASEVSPHYLEMQWDSGLKDLRGKKWDRYSSSREKSTKGANRANRILMHYDIGWVSTIFWACH